MKTKQIEREKSKWSANYGRWLPLNREKKKQIGVNCSLKLLERIDFVCRTLDCKRSNFVAYAVEEMLKKAEEDIKNELKKKLVI